MALVDSERPSGSTIHRSPVVLVVGNGLSGGGAEARLARLAPHLFNGNIDLALLSGDGVLREPFAGEIIHLCWKSRLSYPRVVWRLRRIIRGKQYDVVMAFGLFPIAISSLAIIGIANRPKLIVSEITRPIAAAKTMSRARQLIYSNLRKILYSRGDLITANSTDGLVETCQLVGVNPVSGARVPNIIDGQQILRKASLASSCSIRYDRYLICVGRLEYMKRIDTVLDAFALLKDRSGLGLVIVGDGEARQSLLTQVKNLGLQDVVTFTGRLEDPLPLLKGASAFILASEYEGFSNSALEAMFCDVPVITSFCSSDAREMCDHGAALGFNVGDSVRLSKNISDIIGDESIGRQLVSHAQKYRIPHEMNQAIVVYENIIRSVMGRVEGW